MTCRMDLPSSRHLCRVKQPRLFDAQEPPFRRALNPPRLPIVADNRLVSRCRLVYVSRKSLNDIGAGLFFAYDSYMRFMSVRETLPVSMPVRYWWNERPRFAHRLFFAGHAVADGQPSHTRIGAGPTRGDLPQIECRIDTDLRVSR